MRLPVVSSPAEHHRKLPVGAANQFSIVEIDDVHLRRHHARGAGVEFVEPSSTTSKTCTACSYGSFGATV